MAYDSTRPVFFLSTLQRSGATSFKKEEELIELSEYFQKRIPYCVLSHKQIQNFFFLVTIHNGIKQQAKNKRKLNKGRKTKCNELTEKNGSNL